MEKLGLGLKEDWMDFLGHLQSRRNVMDIQFRKLQGHLDSEQSMIRAGKRELEGQEKELEAKVLSFNSEMKSKGEELNGIERLVEEKRRAVEVIEKRLREVEELVSEKMVKYDCIKKLIEDGTVKLSLVGKSLEERSKEVEVMESRLAQVENLVGEKKQDCDFIVQCMEERKEKLNKYNEDIESKVRQLEGIRGSIDEGIQVVDSTDEQIKKAKTLLEECKKEVILETEKLSGIRESLVICKHTLESKKIMIREMDLKANEFGLKEREIEGRVKEVESREKQVESKVEELNLKEKEFKSLGESMQERQQHLDSQEKVLQECTRGLEMKEMKLEQHARELELKQKEIELKDKGLDLTLNSMEEQIQHLKFKHKANKVSSQVQTDQQLVCTPVSIAAVSSSPAPFEMEVPESSPVRNAATLSSPNAQLSATEYTRNLLCSQNDNISGNQSMQNSISLPLQASRDPEKLVLKMMQVSFAEHWDKGRVGFDEDVMKSNISLLRDISKVKPHVGSHVKEDAISLAFQWQAKLRADTENSLEIMCFLHFIAAYGLHSWLNGDEIVKLLGMICQHKQARELCHTLGFADKIPDFVQNLIERKQLTEAIRFICTFKLIVKLHPVLILIQYVDKATKSYLTILLEKNSPDEKDEVVDNQIAVLRAVIHCIKDNDLESEFPSKDIEKEIGKLEKLKENWKSSVPSVASNVKQEKENWKKRSTSSSSSKAQPLQLRKSKRLREQAERQS